MRERSNKKTEGSGPGCATRERRRKLFCYCFCCIFFFFFLFSFLFFLFFFPFLSFLLFFLQIPFFCLSSSSTTTPTHPQVRRNLQIPKSVTCDEPLEFTLSICRLVTIASAPVAHLYFRLSHGHCDDCLSSPGIHRVSPKSVPFILFHGPLL